MTSSPHHWHVAPYPPRAARASGAAARGIGCSVGRHGVRRVIRTACTSLAALAVLTGAATVAAQAPAQTSAPLDSTPVAAAGAADTAAESRLDGRADRVSDVRGDGASADVGTTPPVVTNMAVVARWFRVLGDTGTHVYALVPDESDNVRAAIDLSVAHMNFIVRPIARRRLIKANRLSEHVMFALQPDTVAVTFDGLNAIVTPRNGDSASWTRGETGEEYDVRLLPAGDTLRQVIASDDGQRQNDFVFLDEGARLALTVTLIAKRLPTPLHYTLIYRRSP